MLILSLLPNPLDFIAIFSLIFMVYILTLYGILYVRKKMFEEGRDWVRIQVLLGLILIVVMIVLFFISNFMFAFLFFLGFILIIPLLIGLPLIIAYNKDPKRRRRKRIEFKTLSREPDWRLIAGIIGPFFISIGAVLLLISSFMGIIFGIASYRFFTLSFTFLMGLIAVIGLVIESKRRKFGRFFCLIAGVLAIAGPYIPIGRVYDAIYSIYITVYLSGSFWIYEPYLIIIGTLIGFVSKDHFFNYFLIKREVRKNQFDIKEEIDKIGDLETFLMDKLSSSWMKIEKSFKAYKVGEMDKTTFIEIAIKNIGTKFIDIFLEQKNSSKKKK